MDYIKHPNFKKINIILIFLVLTFTCNAGVINDDYIGAGLKKDSYGYDIQNAEYSVIDNISTLKINFKGYIDELGDLFISADGWNPYGDSNFIDDNHFTGESWEYGLVLEDTGSIRLYELTGEESFILTSDKQSRIGHEILVNKDNAIDLGQVGQWNTDKNFVQFVFDHSQVEIIGDGIGFHWSDQSGKDVIEGFVTDVAVPEPSFYVLIVCGMIVLFVFKYTYHNIPLPY